MMVRQPPDWLERQFLILTRFSPDWFGVPGLGSCAVKSIDIGFYPCQRGFQNQPGAAL